MNGGPITVEEKFKIIHPIHRQANNLVAFIHALKLAAASKGSLEIVDVRDGDGEGETISVRGMLEHWNMLLPGSNRSDVARAGLSVTKVRTHGNPKKVVARRMQRHVHDILVIGTEQKAGPGVLFGEDLSLYLSRFFRQTTLFVPLEAKPFVNIDSGAVMLDTILLPVAVSPACEASFALLRRLLSFFPQLSPRVVGVHAGAVFPYVEPALFEGLDWQEKLLPSGPVVASIAAAAAAETADLIIMSTNGRDTL
ncbi:MAG: hypothetical protein PHC61_13975, partial [Chitinivibrionales bacterium]|nr:hypothetical protein [Chitinivibrionales bacterium]